jgi:hypothetical protein
VERTDQVSVTTARSAAAPRRVRFFSLGLCATAVAAGAALVASGAPVPALGPVLVLALAAALCVNRFVLFPSEHAATAEAAVLLAAVVGFRGDAVVVGPLVVALLVGPLDALHWEQRAFVRMAYNAGNRGWAVLAAAVAFTGAHSLLDSSLLAWCIVVLVAAGVFTAVDLVLSVVLLRLHGEPVVASAVHVFEVDVLTVPVACAGAAAGFLATGLGWWATLLALVPVAFLPELLFAHARAAAAAVRDLAVLLVGVAVLATFALVTPMPTVGTAAVFVMIAVLAGIEFGVDRSTLVPPMVAVVVAAAVAADGSHERFVAALVATVATVTSWWAITPTSRPRMLAALATAFGAALVVAEVAVALPRTMNGVALGAVAAGLAFEVIAVLAGTRRRQRSSGILWTFPLLAAAVAWSIVGRRLGLPAGGAVVVLALSGACAAAVWWGAPVWRSRVLERVMRRAAPRFLAPTLALVSLAAVTVAVLGVCVAPHAYVVDAAWVSAGFGECATAMGMMGVRQWRFAPHPRAGGLIVLLGVATLFLALVPALVTAGSWWGPVAAAVLVLVVCVIARGPAARARSVERAPERVRRP